MYAQPVGEGALKSLNPPVRLGSVRAGPFVRRPDVRDEDRRISQRRTKVGADLAAERPLLGPLPAERFEPGLVLHPRVDRSSLVTVRMAKHSVPARLIGREVRVSLRASEVVVFDGREEVARHERVVARGGESIVLDHYLEVLRHKPGALPGYTALAAARQAGVFTAAHEAFWQETGRSMATPRAPVSS